MPINEIETHPYLNYQVTDFTDKGQLAGYRKLIIGTFPIYSITASNPVEIRGLELRENWQQEAFMQYFYGSYQNHFWEFFAMSFDEDIPNSAESSIELLKKYSFLITDVFSITSRKNYSPLDNDLINSHYNTAIVDLIQNCDSLKIIYFTSKVAKKKFCKLMNIIDVKSIDYETNILGRNYRLIVLISPAGGGRTVPHFFDDFPLNEEEMDLMNLRQPYAYTYRLRYYTNYLPIADQIEY